MKKCNLTACCLLLAMLLPAQTQKSFEIPFLNTAPELDGKLADSSWQTLPPLDAFTTATPVFGKSPHCQTEVRVFYTQTALYVAARCYDPDSAGVRRDVAIRDLRATGDWFQVSLDTWNDDQLAFNFTVTAAGVQLDDRQGGSGWDAVWFSAVQPFSGGWDVEICIPFTALRFPKKMEHAWGAQFSRYDRSTGELSTWSPQDPVVVDRVIQFGTLTGIRDIVQLKRRSLAVHAQTGSLTELNPLGQESLSQSLGLDAKFGLGSSATLDLSLLPPIRFDIPNDSPPILDFSDGITYATQLPEPRQLIEEERDLFDKNTRIDYYPSLNSGSLAWRWRPQPNAFISETPSAYPLQVSKLSARTGGNWRFGVFNALLGPAWVQYRTNSFVFGPQIIGRETLQPVSDYLGATAEYLLPNNSFINISSTALLAGNGRTDAQPQLRFRLRDRSNSLEVSGATNFDFNQIDTSQLLRYNWNLSCARINRRWGWSLRHWENSRSIIRPDNQSPDYRLAYSEAAVQYRDFRPRGPFLNINSSAALRVGWSNRPDSRQDWALLGQADALDRKFRFYEIQLITRPYERRIRYGSAGLHIDQIVSPEIGGGLAFQTDNRKRFQLYSRVYGTTGLEGEFPSLLTVLNPSWVISPKLRFGLYASANRHFGMLTVLSTVGSRWIFERSDYTVVNGHLEIAWFPSNRFQLTAGLGLLEELTNRREAVELFDGRKLSVVDWTLPEKDNRLTPTYRAGASWFFTQISQLRLSLSRIPGRTLSAPGFPPFTISPVMRAQLDFIWFIDGVKYR